LGTTDARETFGVLPTAARPYLVVTLASRRAAAASLRGPSYGKRRIRIARALLRMGLRTGLAQHVLRDRLSIPAAEEDADSFEDDLYLTDHLMEIFGRGDIALAVRVGRVRPNRKPLIQVLTPDGNVLAYVKVGWNALTRRLIANETRVLAELERRSSFDVFEVPRILHHGDWREHAILVLSPLHGRSFRQTRSYIAAAAAAMNEISRLSAGGEAPLAESAYWQTTKERVTAAANGVALAHLADVLEDRYGAEDLRFGWWHGDWTPWNMARRGDRLAIWDWERSGDGVPVGLDAAHFDFQVALRAARGDSRAALRRTLGGKAPLLSTLPPWPDGHRLLLTLHLLEMSVRREEGRQAGLSPPDSTYLPALAALLEQV
jgi:hypothetical protein